MRLNKFQKPGSNPSIGSSSTLFNRYPSKSTSFNGFWPYLGIAVFIFIFNAPGAFEINILINDDQSRYLSYINGDVFGLITGEMHRLIFFPLVNFFFETIMVFSHFLSRCLIILFLLIPNSLLLFWIYKNVLKLNVPVSFTTAVIPAILPDQSQIPFFIDASGPYITSSIFFLLSIRSAYFFSKNDPSKYKYFLFIILFYFISIETTEHTVFLYPVYFVFALRFIKIKTDRLVLISATFLVVIYRLIRIMLFPWASNTPKVTEWHIFLERLQKGLEYSLPVPEIPIFVYGLVIFLAIFLIYFDTGGKHLLFERPRMWKEKDTFHLIYPIAWGFIWFISFLLPICFLAPYFSARYFFIPAVGLTLALFYSGYLILQYFRLDKHILMISIIILLSIGALRIVKIHRLYHPYNYDYAIIQKHLETYQFPNGAQIAVMGDIKTFTSSYYRWSSGYLAHMLKRKDITGILPIEFNFYDPFDGDVKGRYQKQMTSLYLKKPLFIFKYQKETEQLVQYQYGLRWRRGTQDAVWEIYSIDPQTGDIRLLFDGKGFNKYQKALSVLAQKGIAPSDIMWAHGRPHSAN